LYPFRCREAKREIPAKQRAKSEFKRSEPPGDGDLMYTFNRLGASEGAPWSNPKIELVLTGGEGMKENCLAPAKKSFRCFWITLAIVMSAPLLMAQPAVSPGRARILPSIVKLTPGQQQQFKILLAHRLNSTTVMQGVQWAVNDIPGGNAQIGTIDSNGIYRAPEKEPKPHEIHVCAVANGAANRYLWATVIIGNAAPSYKVVRDWGEPRSKLVHLKAPHGITLDQNGNVIVVDEGSDRVVRYSPDGKFLGEIGLGPSRSELHKIRVGTFVSPRAAAVDAQGNIFVSDMKSGPNIQVFNPDGKFLYMFGLKGNRPGMLLRAHGMEFDTEQRLFVDDVDNFRISVYDDSGKFLYCWGEDSPYPGGLNPPHGLALDRNNDVFVDSYYGPAQKFTADGKFLLAFAYPDPPAGAIIYHTLNGDHWGDIYLSVRTLKDDPKDYISVLKYNDNGDFVTTLRLSTPDRHPKWVTVAQDGTVYAAYQGKTEVGVEVLVEQ
jgi:hypothetical protein